MIMDSPIYLKYQDLYHLDLWEAAKTGDMARLKELLDEGHAIDERQDGATPMYWAQYYLQSEAMEFLLQHGADPNAKGSEAIYQGYNFHGNMASDFFESTFAICGLWKSHCIGSAKC